MTHDLTFYIVIPQGSQSGKRHLKYINNLASHISDSSWAPTTSDPVPRVCLWF